MTVHNVWVIIGENGHACFDDKGKLYCFKTEQEAVIQMADLIKSNPHRTLRLKKTSLELPWM